MRITIPMVLMSTCDSEEWLVPFVPRAAYYGFGEVRVATLALLIFTALSG
jgi:hypothetical protein